MKVEFIWQKRDNEKLAGGKVVDLDTVCSGSGSVSFSGPPDPLSEVRAVL
jgi:hypothetical protein